MNTMRWVSQVGIASYDYLFGREECPTSTSNLYLKFLQKLSSNQRVLDVGVGMGVYFKDPRCQTEIQRKNLEIVGIDVDEVAIEVARQRIESAGLSQSVAARCVRLEDITCHGFDVVVFSESYPVIPQEDIIPMLRHVRATFNGHTVAFINNLEENPTWIQKCKKIFPRWIAYLGRVVNRTDMQEALQKAGFEEKPAFELLAEADANEVLFKNRVQFPFLRFKMKQYLVSLKIGA